MLIKKQKENLTKTSIKGFIKVTRVYGTEDKITHQPCILRVESIESFRPRNVKGQPKDKGCRCAIVTKSGKYLNVKEKFSELEALIKEAL